MYVPRPFATEDERAWDVVERTGGALLVVDGPAGLASLVAPVRVARDRTRLSAHLAKANPWWRGLEDGAPILVVALAAQAYVSPAYYPSRLEDPGVVPTWNYVAAEVRGRLHLHHEREWLEAEVRALTEHFEARRDVPWSLAEADPEYVERLLAGIVGLEVEVEVEAIEGKAKLSQNRPDVDRSSVAEHLARGDLAEREVAQWMEHQ
jgi:transcriptional regulator